MNSVSMNVAVKGSGVLFGETTLDWNSRPPKKTSDPVAIVLWWAADA